MKTLNYLALAFLLAFSFACNQENNKDNETDENKSDSTETADLIKENNLPAFENLDIAFAEYEYTSAQAKTYKTESGSEFTVPKNAFVDADGNPVEGKVDIKYREIKSVGEIITTGVDMKYEKDGKIYDFQTAGMFDIRAYNQGKEVFLDQGKEINVSFASNVEGDYNFYHYNEDDKNWVETDFGRIEVEKNETPINYVNFNMPKPVKLDPAKDLVIEVKANYKKFPHLKQYKGMVWKYAGDKSDDEVKKLLSKIWSGSELKELDRDNNKYTLTMITGKKEYDLVVSPVFSGRAYKKALEQYEMAKKRAELTASAPYKVKRTAPVTALGLHNYDVIHTSDRMIVNADFEINKNQQLLPTESKMDFFLITGNNDVVVRYNHNKTTQLYFSPSADNKLVAVMPGNKVAVMTTADFAKVAEKLKTEGYRKYTFRLDALDTKITSPGVLDEIIAGL